MGFFDSIIKSMQSSVHKGQIETWNRFKRFSIENLLEIIKDGDETSINKKVFAIAACHYKGESAEREIKYQDKEDIKEAIARLIRKYRETPEDDEYYREVQELSEVLKALQEKLRF